MHDVDTSKGRASTQSIHAQTDAHSAQLERGGASPHNRGTDRNGHIALERLTPRDIVALQRTVGNMALARLLRPTSQPDSPTPRPPDPAPSMQHNPVQHNTVQRTLAPRVSPMYSGLTQRIQQHKPNDSAASDHPLHTIETSPHAPTVQRLFRKKKKRPTTDTEMFDTGKAPDDAFFTVSAVVKTGTKSRSTKSLRALLSGGTGHSWIEIRLGPGYRDFDAFKGTDDGRIISQSMESSTHAQLEASGKTTIGFYPDVPPNEAVTPKNVVKQFFTNIPGKIVEPEQAHFAGQERGGQSYPVTDATQALQLLNVIRRHRNHSYNITRYNCTDFVVKAIESIGYSLGKTSNALGWTLPTLMYKEIYKRSELGDRSASYTQLSYSTNKKGKTYDTKHISKKAQKRLDKERQQVAPKLRARERRELEAQAIATYTAPGYLAMEGNGMMRTGEEFGVTGIIWGDPRAGFGEVIFQGAKHWVALNEFHNLMGFPYPNADVALAVVEDYDTPPTNQADANPLDDDKPIPTDLLDNFVYMDFDEVEEHAQEQEEESPRPEVRTPQVDSPPTPQPVVQPPTDPEGLPAQETVVTLKSALEANIVYRYSGPMRGPRVTLEAGEKVLYDQRVGDEVEFEISGQRGYARAPLDNFLAAIR